MPEEANGLSHVGIGIPRFFGGWQNDERNCARQQGSTKSDAPNLFQESLYSVKLAGQHVHLLPDEFFHPFPRVDYCRWFQTHGYVWAHRIRSVTWIKWNCFHWVGVEVQGLQGDVQAEPPVDTAPKEETWLVLLHNCSINSSALIRMKPWNLYINIQQVASTCINHVYPCFILKTPQITVRNRPISPAIFHQRPTRIRKRRFGPPAGGHLLDPLGPFFSNELPKMNLSR